MSLSVATLLGDYRAGRLSPSQVAEQVLQACEGARQPVWITRVGEADLLAAARRLDDDDPGLPLYGVPFAVKDNIDVAGLATSAGCPGFASVATQTAPVVQRLLDAGALLVGKTNMDQFATGLVGTRSPYGRCSCAADPDRVSGGSSSGSALAVSLGLVSFALGTDTAGSGRVPAAFNEITGVKPTRGLLSTRDVLPACAGLDCVSIFTAGAGDAALVLEVAAAHDGQDPYSRPAQPSVAARTGRVAVPHADSLQLTDPWVREAWDAAVRRAGELWELVEVDVAPLLAAAPLLYDAWVAERTTDLLEIVDSAPEGLDPTVASIVRGGAARSATEVFAAMHKLARLRLQAAPIWQAADALLMPTTPAHPTHAEVDRDPVGVNEQLGRFTNFVNLMDLAALAVPGPRRADGLPFGVTLMGPAFTDERLLELAAGWAGEDAAVSLTGTVRLAVAGAHLSGLPLNGQLTERGARLVRTTTTAPCYRLYALPGAGVARPGVIRVPDGGAPIEVEVWELAPAALGSLMTKVPAPLAIGRVMLADGEEVAGFVCEGHAAATALDVTAYGGWRAYLRAKTEAAA